MNATNTFQDGLIMDSHPLATPNNVLTNCLNGTLITYNGNELILQNDVGNSKIPDGESHVKLKDGFIPIGLKEFGGILYIFSVNPSEFESREILDVDYNVNDPHLFKEGDKYYKKYYKSEIGTFPSPDYSKTSGKLLNKYLPLHNYVNGNYNTWNKKTKPTSEFTTCSLNFDVNHPLTIDCQKSYDGSINLIFTDNKNIPRLINTRFSLYGDNEYEIVDRTGDKDTNIYFEDDFEYSTSLHKIVNSIINIKFNGVSTGGNLKVGTYTFYFTLADTDDNESDFVGLSSVVTCHKGNLNDPFSIDGGIENENSYKQVSFTLSNIPRQFSRVYVYYSRNSSDASGNALTVYLKISKYFEITEINNDNNKDTITLTISGYEQVIDVDSTTINTNYLIVDKAKTQSIALNILFYGNISKQDLHYQELLKLSLEKISIKTKSVEIGNVDEEFLKDIKSSPLYIDGVDVTGSYYNVNNIYYYTGYWPGEFYRFGIVYILDDYSITPVFNIKGQVGGVENDYGVFEIPSDGYDLNKVKPIGIEFTILDLPKYVKGYFFVRQKRLQTILAQGVRIGSDQGFSYLPLLKTDKINGGNVNSGEGELEWIFYPSFIKDEQLIINSDADSNTTNESSDTSSSNASVTALGNTYYNTYAFYDAVKGEWYYGTNALTKYWEKTGTLKIPNLVVRKYSESTSKTNIDTGDLGWFTECFITGYKEKKVNGTKIYNFFDLWGRKSRPWPTLGDCFLGSNTVGSYLISLVGLNKLYKDNKMYNVDEIKPDAAIVPEYDVKLSYYNSLFTGGKLQYKTVGRFSDHEFSDKILRTKNFIATNGTICDANIVAVPEGTAAIRAKKRVYSSLAGNASEGHRAKVPFTDYRIVLDTPGSGEIDSLDLKSDHFNLTWAARGIWGPYVGIDEEKGYAGKNCYDVVNIMIPNRDELEQKDIVKTRKDDSSEYYPISKRFEINKDSNINTCFSGDCFICNFAHTMNRNFTDPSFPINTEIADYKTWAKGAGLRLDGSQKVKEYDDDTDRSRMLIYDKRDISQNTDSLQFLNRSDVNAVPLGHIFVTKIYSSTNLCMRSTDGSNITERATFNQVRSFYPLRSNEKIVSNKIPDSYILNGAYEKSLGELIYTLLEEVPALKTNFSNRIVYSDLAIKDSYINNFRTFRKTTFLDYTRLYGEIVKILNYYDGYLLCIFEHAVALITVNEKAVATLSESGFSYITTTNVLSDTPKFLSTEYGSQWADSVIQTATGVYGIDTVAKKIWHYGETFEVLSDLKLLKFLKDNLDLNELETEPDLTKLNIKTHYNRHKQDIMFTFFKVIDDDFIGWNICYNEITKKFTTFYSWIPSYSGNINNTYYSFNNENSINIPKPEILESVENVEVKYCYDYHPENTEVIIEDNTETSDVQKVKLTVDGVDFNMIKVKGGSFTNKYPRNSLNVTVSDYWISETPVTRELYKAVIGDLLEKTSSNDVTKYYTSSQLFTSWSNDTRINLPANFITERYHVPVFLELLNSKLNGNFDLPTHAQWTYAALGGQYSKGYEFAGSNDPDKVAWSIENCSEIQPVATKAPNELGLYDMSGNVWEWCKDGLSYSYNGNTLDPIVPRASNVDSDALFIKGGGIAERAYFSENSNVPEGYTKEEWDEKQLRDRDSFVSPLSVLYPDGGYLGGSSSFQIGFRIVCKELPSNITIENTNKTTKTTTNTISEALLTTYELIGNTKQNVINYSGENAKTKYKELTSKEVPNEKELGIVYKVGLTTRIINKYIYSSDILPNFLWEHNKENNWCNWYDEQHPFEFEFVVADNPQVHKIFNNLKMIANKTLPESFHYEVIGEVYDFKDDKPNMYYRLEKTKLVYSDNYPDDNLGYDKSYKNKVIPKRNPKSAMFPLTVSHVDKKNKIYDTYQRLTSNQYDYQSMSGSEIVYDNSANEFDVATHIKAYPIDGFEWQAVCGTDESNATRLKQYYLNHNILVKEENGILYKKIEYGRRLGNCHYDEDNWEIQIPSINYAEKNENWTEEPPINIAMNPIPEDILLKGLISVPADVETDYWGSLKQTRIRDKYVRIRVRYTGDKLAIISAIITQYKESYS